MSDIILLENTSDRDYVATKTYEPIISNSNFVRFHIAEGVNRENFYNEMISKKAQIDFRNEFNVQDQIRNTFNTFLLKSQLIPTHEQLAFIRSSPKETSACFGSVGTGKKFVTVCRAVELSKKCVNPSDVVITAFTRNSLKFLEKYSDYVADEGLYPKDSSKIRKSTLDLLTKYCADYNLDANSNTCFENVNACKISDIKHILVVDAQDLNFEQYSFIRDLSKHVDSVSLIGDINQSIHAYTSSNKMQPASYCFMLHFSKNVYQLTRYFSFSEDIMKYAEQFMVQTNIKHTTMLRKPTFKTSCQQNAPITYYETDVYEKVLEIIESIKIELTTYEKNVAIITLRNEFDKLVLDYETRLANIAPVVVIKKDDDTNNLSRIGKGSIYLSNIMNARFLEFDYVIGVNVPTTLINKQDEYKLSEAYTVCTRAKEKLFIVLSKYISELAKISSFIPRHKRIGQNMKKVDVTFSKKELYKWLGTYFESYFKQRLGIEDPIDNFREKSLASMNLILNEGDADIVAKLGEENIFEAYKCFMSAYTNGVDVKYKYMIGRTDFMDGSVPIEFKCSKDDDAGIRQVSLYAAALHVNYGIFINIGTGNVYSVFAADDNYFA
jgi:hypothetical protein